MNYAYSRTMSSPFSEKMSMIDILDADDQIPRILDDLMANRRIIKEEMNRMEEQDQNLYTGRQRLKRIETYLDGLDFSTRPKAGSKLINTYTADAIKAIYSDESPDVSTPDECWWTFWNGLDASGKKHKKKKKKKLKRTHGGSGKRKRKH